MNSAQRIVKDNLNQIVEPMPHLIEVSEVNGELTVSFDDPKGGRPKYPIPFTAVESINNKMSIPELAVKIKDCTSFIENLIMESLKACKDK